MMLTITLPPETEARLAEQAAAAGVEVPTLAVRILRAEARKQSLDEVLAPVRQAFRESGMTEDEAAERYEREKHEARARERGRPFDE